MPRMKFVFVLLWGLLSILGALALAHVTGLLHPHEKVNGLWLVVAATCIYVLAYRFYGRWIARQVVELDNQRVTPAVRLNDSVNFHPTNKVVLFGHHFAAIAGAGPLLGPVMTPSSSCAISGSDRPLRRIEATRMMKSCTAPANTAPITSQRKPGRKPNCAASTGPSRGPAPAMAAK